MKFDIIIVGGGMVGAALACALRNTDLQVALIDAAPLSVANDHRLIALNDSSCHLLKSLDIWPKLIHCAAPIHQVHVSYRGHFGTTQINAQEMRLQTLGHVVPAKFINTALYNALEKSTNIRLFRPATLKSFTQHDGAVQVDIGSEVLEGRILIGADGTHSTVRKLLKIPTEITDYDQSAIVTQTTLQRSHQGIAYERFHPTGAIAMLPLSENKVATIWTDQNENIAALMKLSDSEFLDTLQENFGYRLGRLKQTSQRYTYPLQMVQAEQQIKQQTILIGNAAHTLHPIAAQGLNLAFHEVGILADHFLKQDFCLDEFFNDSQQQNASIRLSHHLPSLFTSDFFLISAARQLGMMGLDICQFAKRRFVQQAIGKA